MLKPVVARYQGKVSRVYFRADAGFANPEVYEFLETERIKYAMRLPANQAAGPDRLSAHAPGRTTSERGTPVLCQFQLSGRKLDEAAPGDRQSGMASWRALSPRRVHRDKHEPLVVAFYNKRGTCEQWIKEGKGAIKWTRLSCRTFAANAVRLQLHGLAYNLGNFLRTLATPEPIKDWSLTSLKDKLIKIGAKVVSHGRYVVFQMAEVAIPRRMFQEILAERDFAPLKATILEYPHGPTIAAKLFDGGLRDQQRPRQAYRGDVDLGPVRHNLLRFVLTCVGLSLLLGIVITITGIYQGSVDDAVRQVRAASPDLWVVQAGTNGPLAEASRVPGDTR